MKSIIEMNIPSPAKDTPLVRDKDSDLEEEGDTEQGHKMNPLTISQYFEGKQFAM